MKQPHPKMPDAEIIQSVRRWLDGGKETEIETRWLRRVCHLAERHLKRPTSETRDASPRETKEQLRQRFESWFAMTYPLFREGAGRDTTIKHQLWTAWQVAHLGGSK